MLTRNWQGYGLQEMLPAVRYFSSCVRKVTGLRQEKAYHRERKGGLTMRALFTITIVVTMAAVGLGGCFWHHQQAVATQPLK
jgi:hypothetical protein